VPLGLLYPPPDSLITAGDGDVAVLRSLCCWVAAADYRVPPKAVEEFVVKQDWPGYVVGDAEHACERVFAGASRSSIPPGLPARAAYPPGVTRCATCLAEHFAVGTASRSWMSGSEQDAFSICFSRKRAFGQSLFCRFLAGGRVAAPPVPAGRLTDTAEVIPDQGRAQALQVLNFCVVAYHPKWALAGTPTDRLALTFLFSLHGGTPDEVWLGGEPVAWLGREGVAWRQEETSAPVPQPVYLRVEETFVALFPLTVTDLGRPAAVTVRVADRFLLIELINYAAAARQFSAEDLPFVQNGFAALIEDAQGRDFAGWRRAVRLHISDELHGDMRNVRCRCGQTELAMAYHPATEHLLYAAVDGSVVTDKF
jgi:hypothetical protein